jgi:hypothetical protein
MKAATTRFYAGDCHSDPAQYVPTRAAKRGQQVQRGVTGHLAIGPVWVKWLFFFTLCSLNIIRTRGVSLEGPATGPRVQEGTFVKVKTFAIAAAVAGLTLGTAGTAIASPLSKPKPTHHKPPAHSTPAGQITGSKLKAGLLPASDFGGGYTTANEQDTGKSLWSVKNPESVSGMPCLVLGQYVTGYGQTAQAGDDFSPPSSSLSGVAGTQLISQFASSSAAWSFLTQEAARFQSQACRTQTLTSTGSSSLTLTISFKRLDWTKIGGDSAIEVAQTVNITDDQGDNASVYDEYTVVNAGTNDYTILESNSTDSDVPTWILSDLISATKKLYKA